MKYSVALALCASFWLHNLCCLQQERTIAELGNPPLKHVKPSASSLEPGMTLECSYPCNLKYNCLPQGYAYPHCSILCTCWYRTWYSKDLHVWQPCLSHIIAAISNPPGPSEAAVLDRFCNCYSAFNQPTKHLTCQCRISFPPLINQSINHPLFMPDLKLTFQSSILRAILTSITWHLKNHFWYPRWTIENGCKGKTRILIWLGPYLADLCRTITFDPTDESRSHNALYTGDIQNQIAILRDEIGLSESSVASPLLVLY